MSLLSAEFLSTVLNFVVVVFILWHFGRKPIGEFFQTRSKDIATHVSEARVLSTDAKKELGTWESKTQNAQSEIARQLEDAKSSMAKFREATLTRATAEAKRIAEETTTVASAEALRAKRQLRKELALESLEQARQYLEHHVDSKDSKKLLTDYLERV